MMFDTAHRVRWTIDQEQQEYDDDEVARPANRNHKKASNASTRLDTHAMAYKLLVSTGLDDADRTEDTASMSSRVKEEEDAVAISDHGKEARLEFYLNRSRSDGASQVIVANLREMKQRKEKEERIIEYLKPHRQGIAAERSFGVKGGRDAQHKVAPLAANKGGPLLYIPACDSFEQLVLYGESATSTSTWPTAGKVGEQHRLSAEDRFVPYFTLPAGNYITHYLVDERGVCLESFESNCDQFYAIILVKKPLRRADRDEERVYVRRTLDDWKTYDDIEATFLEEVRDRRQVDRYVVHFPFSTRMTTPKPGKRMEFAVAYQVRLRANGQTATNWDNNNKANYAFWYSG